jgi:pilus assembly protein CpaC
MCVLRLRRAVALYLCLVTCGPATVWSAESTSSFPSIIHKVEGTSDRVEMTVNSSRILTLGKKIPKAQINNKDVLDLTPVGENQVQLFAKKPGVTQVNLWDDSNEIHAIDVVVFGDSRELSMMLESQFPGASIKVLPTATSVILSGYVDRPDDVSRIVEVAKDYYPKVINNINVGGAQQVLLFVKVIEVSRTKLRDFGFDWVSVSNGGSDFVAQSVSGLLSGLTRTTAGGPVTGATGSGSLVFGVVGANNSFFGILQALQQNDIAKVLSEPTLVAYSGRPAYFESGGDVPIPVIGALGVQGVDYRPYGTKIDFVPIVLGNGRIRLEVRPRVSEIDSSNSFTINGNTAPGFRRREVDTGVEMQAGQTLALAGILYNRVEGRKVGIPLLMDVPVVGMAFGRNRQSTNEIELLVLVRPEFASPMDGCDAPTCGPGMTTEVPNDCEMYVKRYLEVPLNRGRDCRPGDEAVAPQPSVEQIPAGEPVIISDQAIRRTPSRPTTKQNAASNRSVPEVATKPPVAKSVTKKPLKSKTETAKTMAPPANTTVTTKPSRAKPSHPVKPAESATANDQTTGPAFIGPTGYDVSN